MKTLFQKVVGAVALVSTLMAASPVLASPQGMPPIPPSLQALIPRGGSAADPVARKIVLEFRCNELPGGGFSTTVYLYIDGAMVASGSAAGMCWNGTHTL